MVDSDLASPDESDDEVSTEEDESDDGSAQRVNRLALQWSQFLAKPASPNNGSSRRAFAWESTSTTLTRAALVPSGLVDDVLVVGAEAFRVLEADVKNLDVEATLLERLPGPSCEGRGCLDGSQEATPRAEPPSRVEWFCFPSGRVECKLQTERPSARSHVFALFADGAPLRGVVLTVYNAAASIGTSSQLWVPVAYCLLTRLAIVPALSAWIEQLAVAVESGRDHLFGVAAQLADEVPRPVAGILSVKIAGPCKEMIHVREHFAASRGNQVRRKSGFDEALARPTGGGGSLWLATMLLGPDGLAVALACALLERPILLVAESASVLAPVAEALLALMRPFEWSHVYVPVLPRPLLELLDAPQPFLLGVLSSWLPEDIFESPNKAKPVAPPPAPPPPPKKVAKGRSSAKSKKQRRVSNHVSHHHQHKTPLVKSPGAAFWQANPVAPGTVAFDLDTGTFAAPGPPLAGADNTMPALPDDFADSVKAAATGVQLAAIEALQDRGVSKTSAAQHNLLAAEAALQAACANQMRRLLKTLSILEGRHAPTVDAEAYVAAHPTPADRPFLRRLVETQHFWQFVDAATDTIRLDRSKSDSDSPPPLFALKDHNLDQDDAYCYTVPPPLPQPPLSRSRSSSPRASSPPRPQSARASVDDNNGAPAFDWRFEPIFGDRPPAATRVYRYGTLADLLCIPFRDLWAQLESDQPLPAMARSSTT